MPTIYHFTYGHKLASIRKDGHLRASGVTIPPHERPALWYSIRDDFEPTALKPVKLPGHNSPVRLTMEELNELAGVYRFVTDTDRVRAKPFALVRRDLGIMPSDAERMIQVGLELGARPTDWYATPRHQSIELHAFERWTGTQWTTAELATEVAKWSGAQVASAATGQRWSDVG